MTCLGPRLTCSRVLLANSHYVGLFLYFSVLLITICQLANKDIYIYIYIYIYIKNTFRLIGSYDSTVISVSVLRVTPRIKGYKASLYAIAFDCLAKLQVAKCVG